MKNIINLINLSILNKENKISPARGKSYWIFHLPERWVNFRISLEAEIASRGIKGHARKGYEKIENGFNYIDKNYWGTHSGYPSSEIRTSATGVIIRTSMSGYKYTLSRGRDGGIKIRFEGPRRAFGTQDLLPEVLKDLISPWRAESNPFLHALQGMQDAEGDTFGAREILAYYRQEGWEPIPDGEHPSRDGWWVRVE